MPSPLKLSSKPGHLPVLKPFNIGAHHTPSNIKFSRWLGTLPVHMLCLIALAVFIYPIATLAQSKYTTAQAFDALIRWLPFLLTKGFLMNVLISFFTMLIGTIAGVILGLCQISPIKLIARTSWFITQLFRNSPGWSCYLSSCSPFHLNSPLPEKSTPFRIGSRRYLDFPYPSWQISRKLCVAQFNRCPLVSGKPRSPWPFLAAKPCGKSFCHNVLSA